MVHYIHTLFVKISLTCLTLAMMACTSVAPVQEMSNARQTLMLAQQAKAEVYARKKYIKAQEMLDQAVTELNSGDFQAARKLALQATQEAKQAQILALNLGKK